MTQTRSGKAHGAGTLTIEEIYERHATAMYRLAVSIVRDHALAEDVVQEAVIKAWRAADSWSGTGSGRRWLLTITHNTAVSTLRKIRDVALDPVEIPDTPTVGEDEVVAQAFLDAFAEALYELDELSRTIVTLREVEEMAYADIAAVTDVSEAVVKTRLFRSRRVLAQKLAHWEPK